MINKIANGPFGPIIFGCGLGVVCLVVLIAVIGLAFRDFAASSFDEVARIQNPNGLCDAVLVETNGGATTSFGYQVFLLPHDKLPKRADPAVASLYGAVRSDKAYGVNLHWQDENTLAIEYLEARHAVQNNGELNVAGRQIRIVMKAGVEDPTAPGGGMLFNLQKGHHQ